MKCRVQITPRSHGLRPLYPPLPRLRASPTADSFGDSITQLAAADLRHIQRNADSDTIYHCCPENLVSPQRVGPGTPNQACSAQLGKKATLREVPNRALPASPGRVQGSPRHADCISHTPPRGPSPLPLPTPPGAVPSLHLVPPISLHSPPPHKWVSRSSESC